MSEPLYCVNHPNTETYLRCNKCGKPICPRCSVRTPVGYRCRDCVNVQQRAFYADFRPVLYLVVAAVALPLALVGAWLVPSLGWYALFLGPLAGPGIAEASHWASGVWLHGCGHTSQTVFFVFAFSSHVRGYSIASGSLCCRMGHIHVVGRRVLGNRRWRSLRAAATWTTCLGGGFSAD